MPSSFIEKNFQNAISQQPAKAKVSEKEEPVEKSLHVNSSKSSIDDHPIFMIYSTSNNSDNNNNLKRNRKSLWQLPVASRMKSLWWIYTWPIKFILTITIPNPKTFRSLYPITFLMCILWIGINAYMIVWMVSVIGMSLKRKY